MGEQPSTYGLSLQEGTSTSRGTAWGDKLFCCFLSAMERKLIQRLAVLQQFVSTKTKPVPTYLWECKLHLQQ